MRSRSNLPVVIAYAAVGLIVLGYLVAHMGGALLFQPVYRVSANFAVAADLVAGDDVTMDGFAIGRIATIQPVAEGAQAQLEIAERYAPLFRDARAMVKTKNLLGEAYVELSRGTAAAGPMANGGTIPIGHTLTPVEVSQVLDALDVNTRDRLVVLINELGESVAGRGADLNASAADLAPVAQSLETIARAVASSATSLDTLLSNLRKVLETLAVYHAQLRSLIGDWDSLMRALATRETDLQGALVHEDQVMGILDQALSGGGAASLHDALAQAPSLLSTADTYLSNGQVIFSSLQPETPAISDVFNRLASVMSGTDPAGDHMWRVYAVAGNGTVSLP